MAPLLMQLQYLSKFHCGFFRLRNDYLRNKSAELVTSALFSVLGRLLSSEQITSRKGIVTVRFQYFASDSLLVGFRDVFVYQLC